LHGEDDSIQTSLKLLFTIQQKWNIVSVSGLRIDQSKINVCMNRGETGTGTKLNICREIDRKIEDMH
jgi:hypothetical protein